ncbi:Glutamate--glyoxylate aminotransferase 2 [Platanthera guangdongensis]|uniref:Glutamate--glyoxylate aminotransferase 2 n=1 Tax=Platanthera guangdongensis TaxID=2320717 RepID=A0ABR2MDD0_9ASPA
MPPKPLDYESLNDNVKKVAYAVRGELYLRASEHQKEGEKNSIEWKIFLKEREVGVAQNEIKALKGTKFLKDKAVVEVMTSDEDDSKVQNPNRGQSPFTKNLN